MTIHHTMSPSDVLTRVQQVFSAPNVQAEEQRKWAGEMLHNAAALEYVNHRMEHALATPEDVDLISRIISTRTIEIREEYLADRPQLFFLDMFRNRGLFYNVERGTTAYMTRMLDYAAGPVRFIADKSDDWPTTGAPMVEPELHHVKYFAKSVEYGILELWQSARDGRDIIGEQVRHAFLDMDEFLDQLIAMGAPLHGFQGLLNNSNITTATVPASGVNPPNTDWPSKTPEEVIFDLQTIRDATRIGSNYNTTADTLILSDQRYSYINAAQIGTNGDNILGRWLANEERSIVGGMTSILPFVPYDTAGPANTPVATAGRFNSDLIDMPLMAPIRLPTEYHGSKWKIGFVGAAGSVHVKRQNRFYTFNGI